MITHNHRQPNLQQTQMEAFVWVAGSMFALFVVISAVSVLGRRARRPRERVRDVSARAGVIQPIAPQPVPPASRPAAAPPAVGVSAGDVRSVAEEPLATQRGGARVRGVAASWPLATLSLYADRAIITFPSAVSEPLVFLRSDVTLRTTRKVTGWALEFADREGTVFDASFLSLSGSALRRTLQRAGWSSR